MGEIHISEAYRTSIIAVDNYSNSDFSGKLYNMFYKQCIQIKSFQQLIKELDTLMDDIGCPMSGMEKRTFTKRSSADEKMFLTDKTQAQIGKIATFAIRVQYRNNASWQGTVKWMEGEAEEHFRSMLELFWLLDSAMKNEEEATLLMMNSKKVASCK